MESCRSWILTQQVVRPIHYVQLGKKERAASWGIDKYCNQVGEDPSQVPHGAKGRCGGVCCFVHRKGADAIMLVYKGQVQDHTEALAFVGCYCHQADLEAWWVVGMQLRPGDQLSVAIC